MASLGSEKREEVTNLGENGKRQGRGTDELRTMICKREESVVSLSRRMATAKVGWKSEESVMGQRAQHLTNDGTQEPEARFEFLIKYVSVLVLISSSKSHRLLYKHSLTESEKYQVSSWWGLKEK